MADDFKYDVFISYSRKDEDWTVNTLLPALENAGLKICIDFRDFAAGKPAVFAMQDAAKESKHVVLVLTRNWLAGEWTLFEALIAGTRDPSGIQRKLIPLLCEAGIEKDVHDFISMRIWVEFYRKDREAIAWKQLLSSLGIESQVKNSVPMPSQTPLSKPLSVKSGTSNTIKFIETINAHHVVELFHEIMSPNSEHRILLIEGEEKLGKSHLVTKVFPWISQQDHQFFYAVIDLRNKLHSIYDVLNQMSAQLRSNIDLQAFTSTYEDWVKNSSTNKDWSTYLTAKFVSDLERHSQSNVLIIFDQLDDASEEAQRWLREELLVQLFSLKNIRVVISGRHTLTPSSIYHHTCQTYKLELIDNQDEYISYCRRLGVGDELIDQSIRDFARFVGYRPGLFAELLWATFIK